MLALNLFMGDGFHLLSFKIPSSETSFTTQLLYFCAQALDLLDIIRRIVWFNREKCPQQLQPKR